jgi:hypothetical protein
MRILLSIPFLLVTPLTMSAQTNPFVPPNGLHGVGSEISSDSISMPECFKNKAEQKRHGKSEVKNEHSSTSFSMNTFPEGCASVVVL